MLVAHPDAPMLITDYSYWRGAVRVGYYDADANELVDGGYVKAEKLTGRTLHKFDWENFLSGQSQSQESQQ